MNKRDLFNIFKMTIFALVMTYFYVLSKFNFNFNFNFNFSKVNVLKLFGFFSYSIYRSLILFLFRANTER